MGIKFSGMHLGIDVKNSKVKDSLFLQPGSMFTTFSKSSLSKDLIFSLAKSLLDSKDK